MKKSSKKLYQDYKDKIVDIVLFGSSVKGKFKPTDIDIAVILKNTEEKEILSLREKFTEIFDEKVHLNFVLSQMIFDNRLFKTLIDEGISLLDDVSIHKKLGYDSGAIFSLNLTRLEKSKKVLFSYALHGHKDKKGIIKNMNGKKIGRAVIFIPSEKIDEFKEFTAVWNVDFYMMTILKD